MYVYTSYPRIGPSWLSSFFGTFGDLTFFSPKYLVYHTGEIDARFRAKVLSRARGFAFAFIIACMLFTEGKLSIRYEELRETRGRDNRPLRIQRFRRDVANMEFHASITETTIFSREFIDILREGIIICWSIKLWKSQRPIYGRSKGIVIKLILFYQM